MTDASRREAVMGLGALALAGALPASAAPSTTLRYTPEPGAKLKLMRWRRFVQGDEDQFLANLRKFTQLTGVEVQVTNEGFEDVRPKVALAANIGSGPDIALGFMEDPHFVADRLLDLTDLADYLGGKYGGWYDTPKRYGIATAGPRKGRWIGLPMAVLGALVNYRVSWVREAGFETFPTSTGDFLKLARALARNGHPPGFALSHATGDSETWMHCLLWGHGARLVDEHNNVVINSPETVAAIEYVRELAKTFIDGVFSWSGVSNNNAFLEGKISCTSNGISIYYAAQHSTDPKVRAVAEDMNHAALPVGPVGHPTELHLLTQAMVFSHTRYPNAARELLRFLFEREQYDPWVTASSGYASAPLKAFTNNPVWTNDPKHLPYRDCAARMLWSGYAGDVGHASAGVLADWIIVDMFAQAVAGQKTPAQAAAEADKRARRHYRG